MLWSNFFLLTVQKLKGLLWSWKSEPGYNQMIRLMMRMELCSCFINHIILLRNIFVKIAIIAYTWLIYYNAMWSCMKMQTQLFCFCVVGFFFCQGLITALILSSWTNHMSPQCTFTQSKVLLLSNVRSGVGARACLFPSSVAEKKRRPIYPGGSGSMSEQTSSGVVASPFLYHTGILCPTFTVHSLQTTSKFVELCFNNLPQPSYRDNI